jgi:hypothetical protein
MIVELLDYMGRRSEYDIGDESRIVDAFIHIISGDEVCEVLYEDGREESFDSSENRIHDFDDGKYVAFMPKAGIDLFHSEKWLAREDSYVGYGIANGKGGQA